ncbi:LacI family DNA-binding transcriptional regulator [Allorhizocola rhizosphaerae]|uniref:LacI family DNA-binding transcriptional regulator n=1 Tax=Allorhizocola rhizosphaerae TaxID=1872709 RepID=UPI000E3C3E44|nr:LacI family DNA-binding transcriptional regulator [Allorhizocola rhizosphaerae]
MKRGRPTIEQVAALAGVSRGTASRVVNDEPYVSAAARAAVLKAVRELGYVPNQAARSLVTRTHETVALVVSGEADDPRLSEDPFFAEVIVGINAVLAETDLELMLMLGANERARTRLLRRLRSGQLDGVMLLALPGADPLCRLAEESGAPTVYGGRTMDGEPRYFVDADNRGGARKAVEHLLVQGRQRIVTITGPVDNEVTHARLSGCLDALGGGADPVVMHADFLESGGYQAMQSLLHAHPDLDAVFAQSDNMAAGALRALREAGRRVPDDVAVVGFDDLPWARHTAPPLTTVNQPIRAMGSEMARMLVALLGGGEPTSLILPTRLVLRESA